MLYLFSLPVIGLKDVVGEWLNRHDDEVSGLQISNLEKLGRQKEIITHIYLFALEYYNVECCAHTSVCPRLKCVGSTN